MEYSLLCMNEVLADLPLDIRRKYLSQIRDLYRQEGWWSDQLDTQERLVRIISGSCYFVIAVNTLVGVLGMGRAICDGVSDAYLQDITVKSEYRKQGVASHIVATLVSRLEAKGIIWIGLIAKNGASDLYRHQGFSEIHEATPMLKIKT